MRMRRDGSGCRERLHSFFWLPLRYMSEADAKQRAIIRITRRRVRSFLVCRGSKNEGVATAPLLFSDLTSLIERDVLNRPRIAVVDHIVRKPVDSFIAIIVDV